MTDEEMAVLEDVAQAVSDGRVNAGELYDRLNGQDILDLIGRVRKAESKAAQNGRLADDASDDVDTLIRRVEVAEEKEHAAEERAKAAERKGAEEMRESAAARMEARASECWGSDTATSATMRGIYAEEARGIRSLPLPGDAT